MNELPWFLVPFESYYALKTAIALTALSVLLIAIEKFGYKKTTALLTGVVPVLTGMNYLLWPLVTMVNFYTIVFSPVFCFFYSFSLRKKNQKLAFTLFVFAIFSCVTLVATFYIQFGLSRLSY